MKTQDFSASDTSTVVSFFNQNGSVDTETKADQNIKHHSLKAIFVNWQNRRFHKRYLMSFNDHLLKDIGVTYAELRDEFNKPFWNL